MKRNGNIGFRIFNWNRTRPGTYAICSVMQQSYIQEGLFANVKNLIKLSTFPDRWYKFCLFHVAQSVWRWLWNPVNKVALGVRKTLMQEFQSIVRSSSGEQAELTYKEACDSPTSNKYGNWRTYLQSHWERWELWCIAWKRAEMCGNHTNNYAEITVRLYKDIVLSRCKAYNVTALVDFTCSVMEKYYVRRLRSFAKSWGSSQASLTSPFQESRVS